MVHMIKEVYKKVSLIYPKDMPFTYCGVPLYDLSLPYDECTSNIDNVRCTDCQEAYGLHLLSIVI